jgi:uncharacterized protein (UPF0335 family)
MADDTMTITGAGRSISVSGDDMDQMIDQLEEWKERQYQRLKAEHDGKYGEQLALLEEVEGVPMAGVRDYFVKLLAIEALLEEVNAQRTAIYADAKDKAYPVKTMRSAIKIARAEQKRDASKDVLTACIAVARSLLPAEEAERSTRPVPDLTGGAP